MLWNFSVCNVFVTYQVSDFVTYGSSPTPLAAYSAWLIGGKNEISVANLILHLMYLGSMENAGKRLGKRLVKLRFLPPGSLCRGCVQSLKTSCRPISMEAQTQGEQAPVKETQVDQTPIEAFEAGPHAEVATKENLVKHFAS